MIITILRKSLEGTVADNTLEHGCGAINIDGTRTPTSDFIYNHGRKVDSDIYSPLGTMKPQQSEGQKLGRWPTNIILIHKDGLEGCSVKEIDRQSGNRKTTWVSASHKNNRQGEFLGALGHPQDQGYNDDGGASRFFKQIKKEEPNES